MANLIIVTKNSRKYQSLTKQLTVYNLFFLVNFIATILMEK